MSHSFFGVLCLALAGTLAAQNPPSQSRPIPETKGAIQYAEPTAEDKGATANLGTDVEAVRERIETALRNDPSLSGTAFTINVSDDTIEITGVANNGRERTAARRIVQSFAGNLRVKDRITVAGATPPSQELPQSDQGSDKKKEQPMMTPKPESDKPPAKKANKPKRDPKTDGDQATEDPREPRKKH